MNITLEEALKLVSFVQDTDGTWQVGTVRRSCHRVNGDINEVVGDVGEIHGNVGEIIGDVGTVRGQVDFFAEGFKRVEARGRLTMTLERQLQANFKLEPWLDFGTRIKVPFYAPNSDKECYWLVAKKHADGSISISDFGTTLAGVEDVSSLPTTFWDTIEGYGLLCTVREIFTETSPEEFSAAVFRLLQGIILIDYILASS